MSFMVCFECCSATAAGASNYQLLKSQRPDSIRRGAVAGSIGGSGVNFKWEIWSRLPGELELIEELLAERLCRLEVERSPQFVSGSLILPVHPQDNRQTKVSLD